MIQFHDPRGKVATVADPYTLSYDLPQRVKSGESPTIGLLANGFPDSENFLQHVGRALKNALPGVQVSLWNKGNAAIPAPAEMLSEIQASCQVAIAAYGH